MAFARKKRLGTSFAGDNVSPFFFLFQGSEEVEEFLGAPRTCPPVFESSAGSPWSSWAATSPARRNMLKTLSRQSPTN